MAVSAVQANLGFSHSAERPVRSGQIVELLDYWFKKLQCEPNGEIAADAIESLVTNLGILRTKTSAEEWYGVVGPQCRQHKISDLLLQDPYTARALEKPRGFAGDAELLDFIYGGVPPISASPLGSALFAATARSSSGLSVVDRRDRLADALRHLGAERPGGSALSIACGHLREVDLLSPAEIENLSRVVGVDQDRKALATISAEKPPGFVQVSAGSVRDIIAGRLELDRFDLVYAAGLFDYLSDYVSVRLLRRMIAALNPGGRLIVGNFTPTNWGRGYMDTFMDWRLEYRTPTDLRGLGRQAAQTGEIQAERVYSDARRNIAYLDLMKA